MSIESPNWVNRARRFVEGMTDPQFFLLAAFLGLLAIVFPPLVTPGIKRYDAPLFPLVATGIEGFSLLTAICLVLAGGLLGFLRPRKLWLWGFASICLLFIIAIAEMIVDPYSHNLWPLEFVLYGIPMLFTALGAYVGAGVKKRLVARKTRK